MHNNKSFNFCVASVDVLLMSINNFKKKNLKKKKMLLGSCAVLLITCYGAVANADDTAATQFHVAFAGPDGE